MRMMLGCTSVRRTRISCTSCCSTSVARPAFRVTLAAMEVLGAVSAYTLEKAPEFRGESLY